MEREGEMEEKGGERKRNLPPLKFRSGYATGRTLNLLTSLVACYSRHRVQKLPKCVVRGLSFLF